MIRRLLKVGRLVFLVLMGHFFLPVLFILHFMQLPPHDLLAWILTFYIAGSYAAFIFFAGAWSWFGTVARSALPALLAVVAITSYPTDHADITVAAFLNVDPILSLCVGTIFTGILVLALRGRRLSIGACEVEFPFHGGTYIVAQGGTTSVVNAHRASPSQRYALDILMLNSMGVRARGLYPEDPGRYSIFGVDVVSPCVGVVAAAQDGFVDFCPPERDSEHRAGNYVAIESDERTIYLAHLQQGSVCVTVGQQVAAGQKLGRVGNSGNTTEPHLHIHAEQGPYPGKFSGNTGIPMRFNGRFLVRNDHVSA